MPLRRSACLQNALVPFVGPQARVPLPPHDLQPTQRQSRYYAKAGATLLRWSTPGVCACAEGGAAHACTVRTLMRVLRVYVLCVRACMRACVCVYVQVRPIAWHHLAVCTCLLYTP